MKRIVFITLIFIAFWTPPFGQINPIENLTWNHYYVMPNNFLILDWEEPISLHSEFITQEGNLEKNINIE